MTAFEDVHDKFNAIQQQYFKSHDEWLLNRKKLDSIKERKVNAKRSKRKKERQNRKKGRR